MSFSSVMGTRRRIGLSHRGEKSGNNNTYNKDYKAWSEMAAEANQERQENLAKAEKVKESTKENWDQLPQEEQQEFVSGELTDFLSKHDFDAWRKLNSDARFGEGSSNPYEKRKVRVSETKKRLEEGKGYKHIDALAKLVFKKPELHGEIDSIIAHIRTSDAHQGLSPKEYRKFTKQQAKQNPDAQNQQGEIHG